jgi:hypothetical protein
MRLLKVVVWKVVPSVEVSFHLAALKLVGNGQQTVECWVVQGESGGHLLQAGVLGLWKTAGSARRRWFQVLVEDPSGQMDGFGWTLLALAIAVFCPSSSDYSASFKLFRFFQIILLLSDYSTSFRLFYFFQISPFLSD